MLQFVTIAFRIGVGMSIEGNAALIALVPLLAPVASDCGIDPIQFAMVDIFTMACGGVTAPMVTLIFVTNGVTKRKIRDFIVASMPFCFALYLCMLLIAFIPGISTGLVAVIS